MKVLEYFYVNFGQNVSNVMNQKLDFLIFTDFLEKTKKKSGA
jgi:hypothetical protein